MSQATVDTLFERYRRDGDVIALAALFDYTAPEIYRMAHHLCGNATDAEDLLQTTFVVAIERADSFREDARVVPWLLGILANKARRLRQRTRRASLSEAVQRDDVVDPADAAEARELHECLVRELQNLSPALRPALLLHLIHGLGTADIARALDIPPGTVRSQVCRGMDALRRRLPAGLAGVAVAPIPGTALAHVRHAVLARAGELAATGSLASTLLLLMKSKLILAVLTAALVAVYLFAWQPSGGRDAEELETSRASVATSATRTATTHQRQPGGSLTRAMVEDASIQGPKDGILVQVVFADTGTPAPGAEVLYPRKGQQGPSTNDRILGRLDNDLTQDYRRSGTVLVADPRGMVRLPGYMIQSWTACAVLGGAYAQFQVERPESPGRPQIVALEESRSITVRVLDADSEALPHAPLGVRGTRGAWIFYEGVTKAPRGLLRIECRHPNLFPRGTDGRRLLDLVPFVFGAPQRGVTVDADDLPRDPIDLHFPPTGRVVIQMRNSRGEPWRRGYASSGTPMSSSAHGVIVTNVPARDRPGFYFVRADEHAECVVPFVTLGRSLAVRIKSELGNGAEHIIQGPTRAGETVTVTLAPRPPLAVVAGRLLLPSGQPATDFEIRVMTAATRSTLASTDADGRFRIDLPEYPFVKNRQAVVRCYLVQTKVDSGFLFASVDIARPAAGREIALGVLTLAPVPILARGHVEGAAPHTRINFQVFNKRSHHHLAPSPRVVSRAGRAFEIRGWPEAADSTLFVHASGYASQKLAFELGVQDLVVQLIPGGLLEIRVPLRSGQDPGSYVAQLIAGDATRARMVEFGLQRKLRKRRLHRKDGDHAYGWWSGLVPGRYRVALLCAGFPDPIHFVEDVRIRPGRTTDLRLDEIDLGDMVHTIELEVLGPQGRPLREGTVFPWHPGKPTTVDLNPRISNGTATLVLPDNTADVLISGPGCRTLLIEGLDANRTIRMQPTIAAHLALRGDVQPIGPGLTLAAELRVDPRSLPWSARGGSWAAATRLIFAQQRGSTDIGLKLASPGRYAVTLELRRTPGNERVRLLDTPAMISVQAKDGQVFAIDLPKGAFATAVDRLSK